MRSDMIDLLKELFYEGVNKSRTEFDNIRFEIIS